MNKRLFITIERIGSTAIMAIESRDSKEQIKIHLEDVNRFFNSSGEVEIIKLQGNAVSFTETDTNM